ncbi:MAG: hypothetical protein K2H87_02835, partial [Duncaniella sp.]|nr:hypothetical protein [Duncaniella sp.]
TSPTPAVIVIESIPAQITPLYRDEKMNIQSDDTTATTISTPTLTEDEKRRILDEVDAQQMEFGIQQ